MDDMEQLEYLRWMRDSIDRDLQELTSKVGKEYAEAEIASAHDQPEDCSDMG